MSFSITYTELVSIAIPQRGVVNFKALHLLLQGILEHIHIADTRKILSGDEDFLQSSQVIIVPREGDAQPIVNPMKRLGNIFDNVIDRLNNIESKMTMIQSMPTTSELLEASFRTNRPVEEMWNIIKLQKRAEANEETIEKVMKTLQDLFTDFHIIKKNVETLQRDVDMIKYIFEKVNPERMDLVCEDLKAQSRKLAALQREVVPLQEKVRALPHPEEIVLWGTLHEAMFTQEAPKLELDMWRSTTSFPESSLRQFEDGSLKTMADSGVLGEDEYIQASGSQAQYGPLFAFGSRSRQEPAKRIGKPGSRPVQWAKPKPAAPGALPLLPRGTPEESGGPVWDMGAFQPSLGPEGQIDRAAFPAMEVGPSRPQPLPQQEVPQTDTHRLSDHEERGNEYDDDYMRDSQEEVPKDGTSQDGSPKKGAPWDGSPKEGAPRDGIATEGVPRDEIAEEKVPRDRIAKEGAPRDGSRKEGAPRDGISKEGAPRDGSPKEGAPRDGISKEGAPWDGISKEGAPQDGISKERASRDGIAKERAPRGGIAKEGAPRDGIAKEGAPRDGIPKKGAPWDRTPKSPKEGSPRDGSPKEGSPRDESSKQGAPRDGSPKEEAPRDGISKERAPRDGIAKEGAPRDGSPKEEAPRDGISKERAPRDGIAKEGAPRDESPKKGASRTGIAKEGAPRDGIPKEGAPRDESPKKGASRTGISKEGAPRDESPKKGASRTGISKEGAPRDESPKKGASRTGIAKEGAARDGSPKKGASRTGISKEGAARDESPKKGSSRTGIAKEGALRVGISKEGSPRAGIAKEGASWDGIAKEGSSRTGIAKEGAPQEKSPREGALRVAISKEGMSPRDRSPREGPSQTGIPKEGASQTGISKEGSPQGGIAKEVAPRDGIPKEGAPLDGIAKEGAPRDGIPKEGAPRDGIPKEGAPQDGIPKEVASWGWIPKERAPRDGTSKEGAPWVGIPKDKTPQHRAPTDKAPQHGASRDGTPQDRVTKDEAPKARALKDMLYKYKAQKDKTPEERPKSPSSNVNKLRSALAAAAANTAVQAAKAAAKSIKDVPESKMSVKAVHEAASGPLGTIADLLSAGTSYGAASVIPFNEDELEDFLEGFAGVFPHSTSKSSLSQAMLRAKQAVSPEEKKRAVQYSMSYIAQMPVKHDSLKEEFVQMSNSVNQRLNYLANMGSFGKLGSTVSVLEDKIIGLQKARLQEEELERIWGHQIESMKNHHMVLDRMVESLQLSVDNLKNFKTDMERLDLTKADKSMLYDELKEKADKDNLASKANRSDLEMVALELNGLVQSMLLKITSQEDDWKKSLKHLRRDLNTKLVHSDLNNLKKDIEEVWMVVRKLLLEGLRFDPDSAAGFKKKLFERVKCISCDRPVEMMTGPQLITIRNAPGLSRVRPASANSFDYLQRQLMREQKQQLHFQNFGVREELGLQKDWGDGPRNETTFKHKSHELSTLYPYGDPQLIDYDSAEVDILGVDGVLYKGRMSSQFGARIGEKDLSAVKVSCPLVQNMNDRVRPGSLLAPSYPPLGLRNNMTSATSLHSATTLARPPSLPPLPQLPPLIPVSRDIQESTGSTKHLKPLRLEHTNP
ncbi:uncharacterized protein C16orf96 homolog [Psammomys obesus]|uniref:uncharacterized protein C16orf96 homolog n=1 Tax=Psammomys obesus TaxID=48139 RepID=UPI0024528A6D|nr:uncharacterized protein C16orf96 homolog [Psammomys obesus]